MESTLGTYLERIEKLEQKSIPCCLTVQESLHVGLLVLIRTDKASPFQHPREHRPEGRVVELVNHGNCNLIDTIFHFLDFARTVAISCWR